MIEIDRLVARDILHAVQPATPARHRAIPWASSVLLKASGSMLTASGSNLDLQVDATGPLQCDDAGLAPDCPPHYLVAERAGKHVKAWEHGLPLAPDPIPEPPSRSSTPLTDRLAQAGSDA